jgi:hypothetical protein
VTIPVVDVTRPDAPHQIDAACRQTGFVCPDGPAFRANPTSSGDVKQA